MAGFKRVFNKKMLFEAFKSLLKLLILGGVAVAFFFALWPQLPAPQSAGHRARCRAGSATNAVTLLFRLGLALVLIGLLDLMYTRRKFGKDMMMSRRELKEEVKRREGDPLIRAKLRELQRENLKQAASVKRVPEADVLITNPEHLADRAALRARRRWRRPMLLAKGADSWAADMRALARRHGIPIYRTPAAGAAAVPHGAARPGRFPPTPTSTWRASTRTSMRSARGLRRVRGAPHELLAALLRRADASWRWSLCWAASCWCCSRRFRRGCWISC